MSVRGRGGTRVKYQRGSKNSFSIYQRTWATALNSNHTQQNDGRKSKKTSEGELYTNLSYLGTKQGTLSPDNKTILDEKHSNKKQQKNSRAVKTTKKKEIKLLQEGSIIPRNLNDIKNIKNDTIVCNNVKMNVSDCFQPIVDLDDITKCKIALSNIEDFICELIASEGNQKTIFLCMAWLKNERILTYLVKYAKRVLGLVNNEDYSTQPKTLAYYDALPRFKEPLHEAFKHTKSVLRTLDRDEHGNKLKECQYHPINSFGNAAFNTNSNNGTNMPSIMHNKVIIFFDEVTLPGGIKAESPSSFITGSFNYTRNANNNLENAIFIKSKKGSERFFNEFSIIFVHSFPLKR